MSTTLIILIAVFGWVIGFPILVITGLWLAAQWYARHPHPRAERIVVPTVPPGRPRYRQLALVQEKPPYRSNGRGQTPRRTLDAD